MAKHTVVVNDDGSFTPARVWVHDGDEVEWQLSDPTDTIIPADWTGPYPGICAAHRPYDPTDPNDFTGPMPRGAAGIFALGPSPGGTIEDGSGWRIEPGPAPDDGLPQVDGHHLARTGEPLATMEWTWDRPGIAGVFIRLPWSEVHRGPDSFCWDVMDREIQRAVDHGKLYSIVIKAGSYGTPSWIFDEKIARPAVKRVDLPLVRTGLGSPADPAFRTHYFAMLRAVAKRIRSRNSWFRALAYIKPSGVNRASAENAVILSHFDNTGHEEVWARDGDYTPAALYEFYRRQTALLAAELPGKDLCYALIQDGFPRVNDAGEYDVDTNVYDLPGPFEQTEQVIAQGAHQHGSHWVVQHCGLQTRPQDRAWPEGVDEDVAALWQHLVDEATDPPPTDPSDPTRLARHLESSARAWIDEQGFQVPERARRLLAALPRLLPAIVADVGDPARAGKQAFRDERNRRIEQAIAEHTPCPSEREHPTPLVDGFPYVGSGCPNRWALEAGTKGFVTGFQTVNQTKVGNPEELDSALRNAWDNSDAVFVEIYEERLWEAEMQPSKNLGTDAGTTIAEWNERFRERRRTFWGEGGPAQQKLGAEPLPDPTGHRHTFTRTAEPGTGPQVLHYVHGTKCGRGSAAAYGVVHIVE